MKLETFVQCVMAANMTCDDEECPHFQVHSYLHCGCQQVAESPKTQYRHDGSTELLDDREESVLDLLVVSTICEVVGELVWCVIVTEH